MATEASQKGIVGACHTVYNIQRVYLLDTGIIQQPVAGSVDYQQVCAHIRVYSPIESMMIVWEAVKEGGMPTMPHPLFFSGTSNLVFLRQQVAANTPALVATAQGHVWVAGGIYFYGLKRPGQPGHSLRSSKQPFDPMGPDEAEIPAEFFKQGILGSEPLNNR